MLIKTLLYVSDLCSCAVYISTIKHWIPFICVMKFLIDYLYFGIIPGDTKLSDDVIPFEIKDVHVRC